MNERQEAVASEHDVGFRLRRSRGWRLGSIDSGSILDYAARISYSLLLCKMSIMVRTQRALLAFCKTVMQTAVDTLECSMATHGSSEFCLRRGVCPSILKDRKRKPPCCGVERLVIFQGKMPSLRRPTPTPKTQEKLSTCAPGDLTDSPL